MMVMIVMKIMMMLMIILMMMMIIIIVTHHYHNQKWLIKKKILAIQGIGPICMAIQYQLYENVCQLIADTQALLSALKLGQKL